nr:patatin family protein [Lachnospiraceae bacterium]
QPLGYKKEKMKGLVLAKILLRKYPAVYEAMVHRHEMYNREMEEIDKREKAGTSFIIRPSVPLNIKRTESDPKELQRVYDIGREDGIKLLPEIKKFLGIES